MKLVIGNKTYSSWSMRPWLALKAAGLPFEEEVIWLRQPDTASRIAAVSPNGKVPVLIDGDLKVFESIAILEYAAERVPALWPPDPKARAHARSICAEMHAGFAALRKRCSMDMKRPRAPISITPDVQADVDRIVAILSDCRSRFGGEGDFLFGHFGNADAMFAPVVNRFEVYAIPVPPVVRRYMDAVMASPGWTEWAAGAAAETQIVEDADTKA